jgi:hypothetical protein
MRLEESIEEDLLVQLVGSKLEVAAALEVAAVGGLVAAAYKVAENAALKVYAVADGTSVVVMFEPTLVVLALA